MQAQPSLRTVSTKKLESSLVSTRMQLHERDLCSLTVSNQEHHLPTSPEQSRAGTEWSRSTEQRAHI